MLPEDLLISTLEIPPVAYFVCKYFRILISSAKTLAYFVLPLNHLELGSPTVFKRNIFGFIF